MSSSRVNTRSMTRASAARVVRTTSQIGEQLSSFRATSVSYARHLKSEKLVKVERKLVRSCETVVLMNDKIRALSKRYLAARREGFKSFRYNNRIKLAVLEGVRNMYYEFARDRAEEVAELRKELYNQRVSIITASDDEDDGSDGEIDSEHGDDAGSSDDEMLHEMTAEQISRFHTASQPSNSNFVAYI